MNILNKNTFTIKNFTKWISAVILQRGTVYFNEGAVLSIEEDRGEWTAKIEGAEVYTATVILKNDNEIAEYFCDCPYDGDVCKHLVAVFLTIREEVAERQNRPEKKNKKNQFESLLKKINIDEYQTFIKHYASKNKDFKIAFEVFFADKDEGTDLAKVYADLLQRLVKRYSAHGYIDYRSSISLAKETGKLIDKGAELAHKKNYRDAFAITSTVLIEMMDVLPYADDSSGSISSLIMDAVELVQDISASEDAAIDIKEDMLNFLSMQLKSVGGYTDFEDYLLSIFEDLAIVLNKHHVYLDFIDKQLAKLTGTNDNYNKDFLSKTKISFLRKLGRDNEADALVQLNLDIPEVRRGEMEKAIERRDFTTAKILINGGVKIAEANRHPGTVLQWKKELLHIAVLEKNITLVRQYCKQFAFDKWFEKQYYRQWKQSYRKDEWHHIIEAHIEETIDKITTNYSKNSWTPLNRQLLDHLSPVYIEEEYAERLFALVKNEKSIDKLMQYHSYLVQKYPAELIELYLPALERQGDAAKDRSDYANLVMMMKKIIADIPFGKEKIITLAQILKVKYPKRPAMIDELNKLK